MFIIIPGLYIYFIVLLLGVNILCCESFHGSYQIVSYTFVTA